MERSDSSGDDTASSADESADARCYPDQRESRQRRNGVLRFDESSCLFHWMVQLRTKCAPEAGAPPTHVQMDGGTSSRLWGIGGTLCVPPHQEDNFLYEYSRDVSRGVPHFVVERPTKVFRLFFDADLDLKVTGVEEWRTKWCALFSSRVCASLRTMYGDEASSRCVVCLVSPNGGEGLTRKDGNVHLHFPNIAVDEAGALQTRQRLLLDLARDLRPLEKEGEGGEGGLAAFFLQNVKNKLEDIIDRSVYKSGLRLLGSHKAGGCRACKGRDRGRGSGRKCRVCNGHFRCNFGRPYVPVHVLVAGEPSEEATRRFLQEKPHVRTSQCSIRLPQGEERTPPLVPFPVLRFPLRPKGASLSGEATRGCARPPPPPPLRLLPRNSSLEREIQERVRALHETWSDLEVHRVHVDARGDLRVNVVCRTGRKHNKFCMIVQKGGRFHMNSNVYFVVNRDSGAFTQRCYCSKHACVGKEFVCADLATHQPLPRETLGSLPPSLDKAVVLPEAWTAAIRTQARPRATPVPQPAVTSTGVPPAKKRRRSGALPLVKQ